MVLISERQQLLFFHVPKCAGESVCKFVQAHVPDAKRYNGILTRGPDRGRDLMHVTPLTAQHVFELASDSRNGLLSGVHGEKRVGRDTVRHLCAGLQRYRTFCFVRSPYTRVLSAFEQRRVRWYAQFWGEAPRTLLEEALPQRAEAAQQSQRLWTRLAIVLVEPWVEGCCQSMGRRAHDEILRSSPRK